MPRYLQLGSVPAKRHVRHASTGAGHKGEGIYYEEVVTTQGFDRAYSILYHLRPPTRVLRVEPAGRSELLGQPNPLLRHYHLKTGTMQREGDVILGRVPLFWNADVTISRCRPALPQPELYRNALSDEVLFVHHGRGRLLTHYGALPFRDRDYVVIPKCTTYRVDFDEAADAPDLLIIESPGAIRFPSRYLNPDGQFRLGAPFAERDLRGPAELISLDQEIECPILIKNGPQLVRYVMAHHPFDLVGWDGMVYPFAFNADDFEPITGTIHQPPPIHQTFSAPGFVICTFAPRALDTHPDAIKVPYAHSNVESDEVLYYVQGRFGSRRGVEEASLTLHPHGIPHGPHPGTIVASQKMARTDELAVMIDTFRPLAPTMQAAAFDDPQYPLSWLD
ncbi:MAG: homogentisate 1,2-dioxygenase [Planctomycetes bacterium]|nr:homogentisate 1,2-dioxygenase [Planctomycetota bacterium]